MQVRFATESDLDVIVALIHGLAEYEHEPDAVQFDRDELRANLFGPRPYAEVLLAEPRAGAVAGFALFFHNFSTWLGKPGIWLEDLFVWPDERGKGYGKALLSAVAKIAVERGCGRFEWSVLDWNEPAIGFYRSLGAVPMDEWTTYRVTGDSLRRLAAASPTDRRP